MKFFRMNILINKLIVLLGVFVIILTIIYIYHRSNQYNLTLLGDEIVNIYLNEPYIESGFVAYAKNGSDVSSKVKVSGNVDITTIGAYKIEYQIGGVKKYRTINVKYNEQLDITMFLIGNETEYVLKNSTYIPSECKAIDSIEGDISSRITVNDNVLVNELGEYDVVYEIINSRGTKKSISRKVIVYDFEYNLQQKINDGRYTITLKIDGEFYQRTKLPDGTFSLSTDIKYVVYSNGNYRFEIYDKFNNVKNVNVEVTEIDNIAPNGTCVVNLYDNTSNVLVKATDNYEIKGYVYNYGTKKSELISDNSFNYSDLVNDVQVNIYDTFNNMTKIDCNINDLSTHYRRSYITENNGYQYKLYIPSTLSVRNKLPLVVFLHGMGECGGGVDNVNANSFPKFISNGEDYDFVMIAPHLTENNCKHLSTSVVKNIIDDIISKYPIDSHRIIITGFSLGAINTYKMIKAYPTFFAGAIPVAETTIYDDILSQTNIWYFVGNKDSIYEEAQILAKKIIQGNSNSKFTVIDGFHNITEQVYKNKEVIKWIMNAYR